MDLKAPAAPPSRLCTPESSGGWVAALPPSLPALLPPLLPPLTQLFMNIDTEGFPGTASVPQGHILYFTPPEKRILTG